MPLFPEDIENKTFLITLRGYDKDEVRAFLSEVAQEFKAALEGQSSPVTAVPSLTTEREAGGSPYEVLGQEVGNVLQVAKESADALRRRAEDEAASLRTRAEREVEELRRQAEAEAETLRRRAREEADAVRSGAQRDADERLNATTARLARLREAETKLRDRLASLQTMLQTSLEMALESVRRELEGFDADVAERDDLDLPGTATSSEPGDNGQGSAPIRALGPTDTGNASLH